MSEGHGAAEPAPMLIEATPFAKSSSNGDNGSGGQSSDWRILNMSSLSFASLWCVWREDLPKNGRSGPCLHFDGAKLL